MKNFIKDIVLLLMGLIVLISCSGNTSKKEENNMEKKGKVLIVFFSHAGENYGVGNIKVGNTKLVADEIQKVTGGDEFEIVADKNYDMPYDALTKLAKEESEKGEKPSFKGEIKNIDDYDTVFIGGPIWWGTYPRVMFTFFDKYVWRYREREKESLAAQCGKAYGVPEEYGYQRIFSIISAPFFIAASLAGRSLW